MSTLSSSSTIWLCSSRFCSAVICCCSRAFCARSLAYSRTHCASAASAAERSCSSRSCCVASRSRSLPFWSTSVASAARALSAAASCSLSSCSCASYWASNEFSTAAPLAVRLTRAWLRIALARDANCSVVTVSSSAPPYGETHAIIAVRQLPPSESCRMRVSFESRYGTCTLRPLASHSVDMTLASAESDRLIFFDSSSRSPLSPMNAARSLPARSTRLSRESLSAVPSSPARAASATASAADASGEPLPGVMTCSSTTVNSACERELTSLIRVAAVVRARCPRAASAHTSCGERTVTSVTPSTKMPLCGSSRIESVPPAGASRSESASRYSCTNETRSRKRPCCRAPPCSIAPKSCCAARGMMPASGEAAHLAAAAGPPLPAAPAGP